MNRGKLESVLQKADFSPYQAEAFVTLLWLQEATATEVVEACTIPQPRIYDVLRELDNKGYIEIYEEEALRARIHNSRPIVDSLESRAEQFSDAAQFIEETWKRPPVGEHRISVLGDFKKVIARADNRIQKANTSIQISSDVNTLIQLSDQLEKAKQRGVFIRASLFENDSSRVSISELRSYFNNFSSVVKERHQPAPFLALIDGQWSYIGLRQNPANEYGISIHDQALSSMIYWYFQNSLWENWETIYSDRPSGIDSEYVEIRQCIQDIQPLLDRDKNINATITGYDATEGKSRKITGRIVTTISPEKTTESEPRENSPTARSTIIITDGEEEYSVGGFGAILEDIKATRININTAQ